MSFIPGSRTEPEPEFYKPVLGYFCGTLAEPESSFSKSQERTGTEPIEKAARSVRSHVSP